MHAITHNYYMPCQAKYMLIHRNIEPTYLCCVSLLPLIANLVKRQKIGGKICVSTTILVLEIC